MVLQFLASLKYYLLAINIFAWIMGAFTYGSLRELVKIGVGPR